MGYRSLAIAALLAGGVTVVASTSILSRPRKKRCVRESNRRPEPLADFTASCLSYVALAVCMERAEVSPSHGCWEDYLL